MPVHITEWTGDKTLKIKWQFSLHYHERAPLVLERGDYVAWFDSRASATALFAAPKRLPLHVEPATV